MEIITLEPANGRKSFNNKAKVIIENDISSLISYNTKVAEFNNITNELKIFEYVSTTTGTHINSFLNYCGLSKMTKEEILDIIE